MERRKGPENEREKHRSSAGATNGATKQTHKKHQRAREAAEQRRSNDGATMEQRWSNECVTGAKLFSFGNDLRPLCFEVERGKEQRWSDEKG